MFDGRGSCARWSTTAVLMLAATTLLVACGDAASQGAARATADAGSPPSAARAVPPPRPPAGSSPRRGDGRWAEALGSADPAAQASLAAHVGVIALADALDDEDAVRAVALRAIPHADGPDLALGALAAALDARRGDEAAVADTIEGVLVATRRDREITTPDGAAACADALDRVASGGARGGLAPERARPLARRLRARFAL